MKTKLILLSLLFVSGSLLAQTDWSKYNFEKEHKRKVSINGGGSKTLKNNKTFINGYAIHQATLMKGSESSATKAVYSKAGLGGIDHNSYQIMVDELYLELVNGLQDAGIHITDGGDVLTSDFASDRKSKEKRGEFIGNVGTETSRDGKKKITDSSILGYRVGAVHEDVSFYPTDKNLYLSTNITTMGNFYQKLVLKENYNLMMVDFYVTFASFDGGRGYKSINLQTNAVMAVSVMIYVITPGGKVEIYYKDMPVWGNADWSLGLEEVKENASTSEWLGLARSGEYYIMADPKKYITEAKSMIRALQNDFIKGIKTEL
ncbi:hypothetical protein [Lentimicrobium sp. S6]|uniref:hypothetical protein n=1 Tax=Lentimicrobium sp. S6 TaxID=2735872 RepID=UPI00155787B2|nr:hypothetical protein [Lentimicrobium sp. S6]NPD45728.1 hypothetical protein [Lentimicrobium sp. S6]